jgi:hypothetical protein
MEQKSPVDLLREATAQAFYELDQAEAARISYRDESEKKEADLIRAMEIADVRFMEFRAAYLRVGGDPGKFKGTSPDGKEFDFVIAAPIETRGNNGAATTKKANAAKARSTKSRV